MLKIQKIKLLFGLYYQYYLKMKTILLSLAVTTITLTSCGYSTPVLNSEEQPFVVYKILPYYGENDSFVKYVSRNQYSGTVTWETSNTALILPKGMYNIGDTIKLFK